ncbi:amidohydrolase family protein [Syntrophomonas palmitatica]|uniref:amidohydrolase family protein n=1 Tax=Syntrophomonas palmitatica TaxID=402877 RepID=UPI000B1A3DE4
MTILLDNISIIPMTGEQDFIEKGYLIIEGQFIKDIGKGTAPSGNYNKVIDGTNRVVFPGFVNAHTHAAMTLLRGYADDMPLMEWLETKIWPMEDKLTGEDVYWGTMLAVTEMIKSGTTCFMDMYFFMDETAQAVAKSGIRAVLSRGMVGIGPSAELAITESRELVGKWHRVNVTAFR